MIQLNIEYDWLKEDWSPKEVRIYKGKREMTSLGYDDYLAQTYGYKNHNEMIQHDNLKYNTNKIKYGDKYIIKDIV